MVTRWKSTDRAVSVGITPGAQRLRWTYLPVLFVIFVSGCVGARGFITVDPASDDPPADTTVAYRVFLIGDTGAPRSDAMEPTFRLLKSQLDAAGKEAAVLFLGDNIYPSGMPGPADPWRAEAERRMDAQLAMLEDFEGRVIFIPGNHDWGGDGIGGNRRALARQEAYVEAAFDGQNVFLPDNAFPGPVEVRVNDWLTLVPMDTQWWLEPQKQYGDTGQYQLEQEGEVLIELYDILRRNAERDILVAAHHPIFTNGSHGGRFTGRQRFPVHSISRRYLGTPQDLSNYRYRQLREGLLSVFERHEGLIYAAGHDHNLQYFRHDKQHYVVSGSGTKLGYVDTRGGGISFGAAEHGFAVVDYYANGSTWLTFMVPEGDGERGRIAYRAQLQEPGSSPVPERPVPIRRPATVVAADTALHASTTLEQREAPLSEVDPDAVADEPSEPRSDPDAAESFEALEEDPQPYLFVTRGMETVAPGPEYRAGALRRFLLGRGYRDVWALPVEIPVIDLEETAGGLIPLRRGGGLQTVSLHMKGGDGDQYVLRSINKDPEASIPSFLRRTLAHDVVDDQTSAAHPYGAFVLPPMLNAAGIYHTDPRLVYVPDSPRLGIYREEFAGMVAMIESRPDEDQRDEERFGRPENIIGSTKLFEEIEEDNDERVDERAFARARLFDMWIGDWDRHKDQWRWSEFDVTPGKIYKPVPRDRDFAFFKFDGLLPRLARTFGPLASRRLTNFERGYHDVLGLNYNGSAMDRRFTSSLTRADWISIADSLRASLVDSAIVAGLSRLPQPVYARYGDHMLTLLRERREKLPDAAEEYYRHLAETVDIVGSDKHERFEVRRLNDWETEVVMYKTKKEGDIDRELLRRVFHRDETDEIRLYGLGGLDQFIVTGEGRSRIRVRAIGGEEEDVFVDETRGHHVYFYDDVYGNSFELGRSTRVVESADPLVNDYQMLRHEVDAVGFVPYVERNADDGFLLGGGVAWIKQGFRKNPFASRHAIRANYAFRTGAYNILYEGDVTDFAGPWDLAMEASYLTPHEFDNFFGFGNDTPNTDLRRQLFSSRLSRLTVAPDVQHLVFPFVTARVGPHFHYWNIERPADYLPPLEGVGLADHEFTDTYFGGVHASLTIDGTDSLAATRQGFFWENSVEFNQGVRHATERFVRLGTDMRYYYTFTRWPWLTLAFRGGGATNIGDFRFYQANTLGNRYNLRGFLRTRFSGHSSVFTNFDVRIKLAEPNLYLTRGEFGVYGFADSGRVWASQDDTNLLEFANVLNWHRGYGGGIWFSPFYRLVLTSSVEVSKESTLLDVSIGFFF